MTYYLILFGVFVLGGTFGVIAMALCIAAKYGDRQL